MTVTPNAQNSITVALDADRPSLFGSLLYSGDFHTRVQSTAQALNSLPLCIQVFGPQPVDQLLLADGTKAMAASCLVHAKGAIDVQASGDLSAGEVETESATAAGQIKPQALTDAPPLADPFASLPLAFPEPCSSTAGPVITVGANRPVTLAPRAGATSLVVQSPIIFDGTGGTLTLAPGEYYFCQSVTAFGGLQAIAQQASLGGVPGSGVPSALDSGVVTGSDVALIFADGAKFNLGSGPIDMGDVI